MKILYIIFFIFLGSGTDCRLFRVKIGQFICSEQCENNFINYIQNIQTYILDVYQINSLIYDNVKNPGIAVWMNDSNGDGKKQESTGELFLIYKEK